MALARRLGALPALLLLTPAFAAAAATARGVGPIVRDLVTAAQGPAVPAKGTPAFCGDRGPDAGSALWYFGEGPCAVQYLPSTSSMVTSVSLGELKSAVSPEGMRRIEALLDELDVAVRAKGLDLQDKLVAQSTVWELVYGIERTGERDSAWSASAQPMLCRAARLLRTTAFRQDEVDRLPANLGDVPRLAKVPEIEDLAERLLKHDSGVLEVLPATDLHADLLFGRFTARVFLTASAPDQRDRLKSILTDASTPYPELKGLPQKIEGLEGVLVLFFNVLGEDQTVLPTPQVAVWQQYTFDATVPIDQAFADAAKHIRFLTVEFEKDAGGSARAPRYRRVAADEMSSQGLLNVKPIRPGAWVTTTRGQCLKCHVHQVATFDTHGRRKVAFSPPMVKSGAEVVTPYYHANVEARLRKRVEQCAASPQRGNP